MRPRWSAILRISAVASLVSPGVIPAVGSSSRSSVGSVASARQISRYRCSPCDRFWAGSSRLAARPNGSRSPVTRASTSAVRHNDARRPDSGARDCAATRTFSRTEIAGKRFVIWKVFAMPSRLIRSGGQPVISWPRKVTRPALGA